MKPVVKLTHKIKKNKNLEKDKVFTPDIVAKDCYDIIKYRISPTDHVSEPFYGGGAFFKCFEDKKYKTSWHEIDKNKDFFDIPNNSDITRIITNHPYSILTQIIQKMIKMENLKGIAILVNNLTMTPCRLAILEEAGFHATDLYIFQVHSWFGRQYFWNFEKLKEKPLMKMEYKRYQYKC